MSDLERSAFSEGMLFGEQMTSERVECLEKAIRKALRKAESNGMGEWRIFADLRKALDKSQEGR